MRYLVAGLESGCTKITSKLIAYNAGLIEDVADWDAFDVISDDKNLVCHRSLPHGKNNDFIDIEFAKRFDHVILSTRDWNCSLLSKIENHEHNKREAVKQHERGTKIMMMMLEKHPNVTIFSPETAFLLQATYTKMVLRSIGFDDPKHIEFANPNMKYLKEE